MMLKTAKNPKKVVGFSTKTSVQAGQSTQCWANGIACGWFGDQDACWQVYCSGNCQDYDPSHPAC